MVLHMQFPDESLKYLEIQKEKNYEQIGNFHTTYFLVSLLRPLIVSKIFK
jgi:hypothetical protein